ncbi:MAG: hypothetical protein PHS73_04240 [Candidatus Peribacteraceae bacterium]|nr:hypothetical protein [Candidatus Peribacteraceae bacterium]
MNILVKSFDGSPSDKDILERALKGLEIGTCISIANHREFLPEVPMKEHIWMDARALREDPFRDVDWNGIAPLDEKIIESMRHCEVVYMNMIGRYVERMPQYALAGDIPYEERRQRYFDHLRYWNNMLDAKSIDLVLMFHCPHQGYDYVIYNLCKKKNIPVLFMEHFCTLDRIFVLVLEDWEESVVDLQRTIRQLQDDYRDTKENVPLSPLWEHYFERYRKERSTPWYMPEKNDMIHEGFIMKWWEKALRVFRRDPWKFLRTMSSRSFWARKRNQHRTILFYNQHCRPVDLSRPFIYVPLQLQPEATTMPLAGAFADQERIVQLLAAHLPDGVSMYVKEHPAQGERCRSIRFYQSLLAIPSVTFVKRDMDTHQLLDHALAVASATGTVCFEAILQQKPVLMFGHFLYQFAPGVYPIHTADDCKRALEVVCAKKDVSPIKELRLFLKALEKCTLPMPGFPGLPFDEFSEEEKAQRVGAKIQEAIRSAL